MTTEFKIFHVDDCMYVAATGVTQASAHVKGECGDDCGDLGDVKEVGLDLPITRVDVDGGEVVTPESMTTAGDLVREDMTAGKVLPFTVCFDRD